MKKTWMTFATILVAGAAIAAAPRAPQPAAPASSALLPVAVQTYADAYNNDVGPAHFLVGTADPSAGPPNGNCQGVAPGCTAASTIGRAAYVGSICINCPASPNGNQMAAIFAFPADAISTESSKKQEAREYAIRLNNFQNFTGYAHNLSVRVLRNRGDNGSDFGAEAIFKSIGPFGVPVTGGSATNLITVVTESRGTPDGSASVPARGVLTSHAFGVGPLDSYDTYDRSLTIPLGDISEEIEIAKASGASYTTCRHSCAAPLQRNLDCDLPISNALYIAINTVSGGNRSSSVAIQDGIAVDNIIHLHGDCDFDGSQFPGDIAGGGAGVELLY